MFETQVFKHGNGPAILLGPENLHALGVGIGDSVQVIVANGEILIRPLTEQARRDLLHAAVEGVMVQRKSVFEELAKGAK